MKVLLIGGSGNISPAIAAELINMGHVVTVFNRGHNKVEGTKQIIGDRYYSKAFVDEMKKHTFDCIIDQICFVEERARDLVDAFGGPCATTIRMNACLAPLSATCGLQQMKDSKKHIDSLKKEVGEMKVTLDTKYNF